SRAFATSIDAARHRLLSCHLMRTPTTVIYTLSLHDALPILSNMTQAVDLLPPAAADQVVPIFITVDPERDTVEQLAEYAPLFGEDLVALTGSAEATRAAAEAYRVYFAKRSEEHTSELQSRENLVCRLLLEKKNR